MTQENKRRTVSAGLWVAQGLLAALFLFAGAMKLVMPLEQMQGPVALPGAFLRFIGVAEVLGAIGLVLPAVLRIKPKLTPLAAQCLIVIMIGATTISVIGLGAAAGIVPFVTGVLLAVVAVGRTRWAPRLPRARA